MKDVFIVGAGMAGVSCALALARRGTSTIVLEKDRRESWSDRMNTAASLALAKGAVCLETEVDIRFEFPVDRVSRIDGSAVLVAWNGDAPVIARCGVLAARATAGDVLVPAPPQWLRQTADVHCGQTGILDLFVCGALSPHGCDTPTAWKHGQEVAKLVKLSLRRRMQECSRPAQRP